MDLRTVLLTLACLPALLGLTAYADQPLDLSSTYYPVESLPADSVVIMPLRACTRTVIEARAAVPRRSRRSGQQSWGLIWGAYPRDYYKLTLRHCATGHDEMSKAFVRLDLTRCGPGGERELISTTDLYERHGLGARPGEPNTLQVMVGWPSGHTVIMGGHGALQQLDALTLSYPDSLTSWGIIATGGPLTIESAVSEIGMHKGEALLTSYRSEADIDRHLAADGRRPLEGYWEYMDRENDPELALPGGRYRLALVDDGRGGYDILYVGGAEVNASQWHTGMLRGHLTPTKFADHYDLEWVDASFERLTTDLHADIASGQLLTLAFPLYGSTLRFRRAD